MAIAYCLFASYQCTINYYCSYYYYYRFMALWILYRTSRVSRYQKGLVNWVTGINIQLVKK